jgi:hypothetical protein
MKKEQYKKEVLERLDEEDKTTCEDCREKDKISHAIVDHRDNTVKVVCDKCFRGKYQDFIYSGKDKGKIH